MEKYTCVECGTPLVGVNTCREYFDKMIAWDFSDFTGVGKVHHLTVLCYYLQHPSNYSTEGLNQAIRILKKVIENNFTDKKLYQEESNTFSSSHRTWNVAGTPANHGKYSQEIRWTLTVSSVVKDGILEYPKNVKQWANTIYNDLKKTGEID